VVVTGEMQDQESEGSHYLQMGLAPADGLQSMERHSKPLCCVRSVHSKARQDAEYVTYHAQPRTGTAPSSVLYVAELLAVVYMP
jgi:hypothetical protein